MDGILCYSPRWDEACSDCMFAIDEGCKLSKSPNIGPRDGMVVCDDYVLVHAVVGQVDGADADRASLRDLTAPSLSSADTTSPGTAGEG